MNRLKNGLKQFVAAVLAPLLVGLSACGGGDHKDPPHEIPGLVTIEVPTTSPTFGPISQATASLSGSRSATVTAVTWNNSAGGSGIATLTVEQCFFGAAGPFPCNHGWTILVPLAIGANTITVKGTDNDGDFGQATITITRT